MYVWIVGALWVCDSCSGCWRRSSYYTLSCRQKLSSLPTKESSVTTHFTFLRSVFFPVTLTKLTMILAGWVEWDLWPLFGLHLTVSSLSPRSPTSRRHWQWCLWTPSHCLPLKSTTRLWMTPRWRSWWRTTVTRWNCWRWAVVPTSPQLVGAERWPLSTTVGVLWDMALLKKTWRQSDR